MKYETYHYCHWFMTDNYPKVSAPLHKICPDTEEWKETKRILIDKFKSERYPMPEIYLTEVFAFDNRHYFLKETPVFIIKNGKKTCVVSKDKEIIYNIAPNAVCSGRMSIVKLPKITLSNNYI